MEDILDLAWSQDGSVIISGGIDNSAIVWNVATGKILRNKFLAKKILINRFIKGAKIAILKEPKGFVQGVAYDPLGTYYTVISTDRSLRIYSTANNKCIHNVNKIQMSKEANKDKEQITPTVKEENKENASETVIKKIYF